MHACSFGTSVSVLAEVGVLEDVSCSEHGIDDVANITESWRS